MNELVFRKTNIIVGIVLVVLTVALVWVMLVRQGFEVVDNVFGEVHTTEDLIVDIVKANEVYK